MESDAMNNIDFMIHEMIEFYFPNETHIKETAIMAHNGSAVHWKLLAEYFEKINKKEIADACTKRAELIFQEKGTDLNE